MVRKKTKSKLESQEQMDLVPWLVETFGEYGFVHVPNQRWAKIQYLVKLRKMGVKTGFPDILIMVPPSERLRKMGYHACAVELKRISGGKVSDDQIRCIEALEDIGVCVIVAYGADDAKDQLTWLYRKEKAVYGS